MLPREAFNNAVAIALRAIVPAKNGVNDLKVAQTVGSAIAPFVGCSWCHPLVDSGRVTRSPRIKNCPANRIGTGSPESGATDEPGR